jgi:hypothetical protein
LTSIFFQISFTCVRRGGSLFILKTNFDDR